VIFPGANLFPNTLALQARTARGRKGGGRGKGEEDFVLSLFGSRSIEKKKEENDVLQIP